MAIKELFKNQDDDPIAITSVTIDEALMTLKENKTGATNWDIFKTQKSSESDVESGFKINIEDYKKALVDWIPKNPNKKIFLLGLR